MWELDGQDNSLLQRLFGSLQTCDVFPPNIWLLCEDGAGERTAKLLRIGVLLAIFVVPGTSCQFGCPVPWLLLVSTYLPAFPLPPSDLPFAPMADGFLRFAGSF
jgi:hypothetical protein